MDDTRPAAPSSPSAPTGGRRQIELAPPVVAPAGTPRIDSVFALQAGVVIVVALYLARDVLMPVTLAILLSFVLAPVVDFLRRAGLGRVPSVLLAAILAISIIGAIGAVIGSQVANLASDIPRYSITIEQKFDAVRSYTVDHLAKLTESIGVHGLEAKPAGTAPSQATTEPPARAAQAPAAIASSNEPWSLVRQYLAPILSPIATLGIVFVVAIFALLQKEDLRDRLIRLFGSSDLHRTTGALDDAGRRLSRYFLSQLAVNASFGSVVGVGLFFIGVPNPVLWGILSTLLRFIPYIGSFTSALLPIALAAGSEPGWSKAIETASLFVVVETITSQAVEPYIYGHSTGLSPFAVVVAAIFWSWIWGPVGLILSTPLTLCLVVLGRYVERLQFVDVMLGDRPALSPVESFYQRTLAGDADEALDHAEIFLRDRSLSSYYDEVALKGLQLAARDSNRGVLRSDQIEQIKRTIIAVAADLAERDDKEPAKEHEETNSPLAPEDDGSAPDPGAVVGHAPPPDQLAPQWRSEAPVLCLAGRGPLDEAASVMLAQLLRKHGLGARVATYGSASREGIGSLDVSGLAMICITYLDVSGAPSHLRFMLRRLRQRAPGASILVGVWPRDDAVMHDERLRGLIGADFFTTSLGEAVAACVDHARAAAATDTFVQA